MEEPKLIKKTAYRSFRRNWYKPWNWEDLAPRTRRVALAGVLLTAAVGLTAWGMWEPRAAKVERLRALARDQSKAGDHAAVGETFARLAAIDHLSEEERFNQANSLAAAGDQEQARKLIESLAEVNYPPAQFWLAGEMRQKLRTASDLQRYESHLTATLKGDPQNLEARRWLAELLTKLKRYKEAIPHLQQLADHSDSDRIELAVAYASNQQKDVAIREARTVLKSSLAQMRNKANDLTLRDQAFRAALLLDDFETANEILKTATRFDGETTEITAARAKIDYLRAAAAWISGREVESLEFLARSSRHPQVPRETFERLNEFVLKSNPLSDQAREAIFVTMAKGGALDFVHTLLGIQAHNKRRIPEARLHFEAAIAANPRNLTALNNLAWLLTWQDRPELEPALNFVNQALELKPDRSEYIETRGQVLARMGRSHEAIKDLQRAVRAMPKNARLHATLSEVYLTLGMPDLSRKHADDATRLSPNTPFVPIRVAAEPEQGGNK